MQTVIDDWIWRLKVDCNIIWWLTNDPDVRLPILCGKGNTNPTLIN